jgi:DNA polymerase (family 10)
MTKDDIALALEEIATLLELTGENDFRVRAYRNGARAVQQLEGDFKQLVLGGKLSGVRGIGDALQEKITTLVTTGQLPYLEELRSSVPPGLREFLKLPGIGPKKVKVLHAELGLDTIDQLKAACESGEVAALKGFGKKTAEKILEGITYLDTIGKRVRTDQARTLARELLEAIQQLPGVERVEVCGSLRRARDTSKDIDLLVSSVDAAPIMQGFITLPQVFQVVNHGPTKSSIVAKTLYEGEEVVLNADLRVVAPDQFPFALVYFTGSKEHNIRLRQRAIERGLTLNEYALAGEDRSLTCRDEVELYEHLDLEWIPPELREDTGEIEAAATRSLPRLLEAGDLRGVFHNHTTASDGTASLEAMARASQVLGWEYFGVGDHSQSLTVAHGLSPERVRAQWEEIDNLNKSFKKFRIFKGIECDILPDGSLDYDDDLLAGFDYVVASVHTHFNLSEDEQTERICRALRHPATTMLGHATGRLLLRRPGYRVDLEKVLQVAAEQRKWIEINAQPRRLDLEWTWVKRARALGITLVINPDAHSPEELALTDYGVAVARRGWLTKEDVANTRSLKEMEKLLAGMKSGRSSAN